ncbi:mechanosensitive ion channel family protein [Methylobrevis pamukkalensis]|uniref:Small-conductance mechanosensitive channel n=1 Tax=Methylobrevis pamukkalensis TaxID=1439726 RepID=A0A1E3GZW8_9HYPH|nr:mechanosensitive ion channel domain-containing protein [Methylobrevis pamukkalensis]ODN69613.1 Small-conductance mechanosensitive channel [Methylobrevis pamukkalensis]
MDINLSPQELDTLAATLIAWAVTFLPRLIAAALILTIGLFASRWLSRGVSGLFSRTPHVDATVRPVIAAVVRYAVVILAVVLSLGQLGVQTTSLLAIIGAAGLAVGLALQGTLTNIAAGVMLLWLRPFKVGDYIEVGAVAGTVKEIGLFVCELETFDGIYVLAPNSAIWNVALRNHSRNGRRMVTVVTTVPKGGDIAIAAQRLKGLIGADDRVLAEPEPLVFVDGFTGAGTNLTARFWTSATTFAEVQRSIIAAAVDAVSGPDAAQAPVQVTRTVPPDADPSRLAVYRPPVVAAARRRH